MRVMLVDDEESAVNFLDMLLAEVADVEVVGKYINPFIALEAFNELQADVVFLDIQMPGIPGMELAAKLRALSPKVRIVFTTAYSNYAIEAFNLNATDYLLKPFTQERLQDTISRFTTGAVTEQRQAESASTCSIQLLGRLHIHATDKQTANLSWKIHKEKELCAFLLHHCGRPLSAGAIIEAVWPGSDPFKARTYLYTCFSYLRKNISVNKLPIRINKINDGYVLHTDESIDVTEFEQLLDGQAHEPESDEWLLDRLDQLYTGEYLHGCLYEWAMPRREQLNNKYIAMLQNIYRRCERNHNRILAERCLLTVLKLSPDAEKEGRELMRLYIESGRRTDAIKLYYKLASEVRHNLGVELEEETIRIYKMISQ